MAEMMKKLHDQSWPYATIFYVTKNNLSLCTYGHERLLVEMPENTTQLVQKQALCSSKVEKDVTPAK